MSEIITHIEQNQQRLGLTRAQLIAKIEYARTMQQINIRDARRSLWRYCQLKAPKFYTNDKPFLIEICETLQALYEKRLFHDGITDAESAKQRIARGERPMRKLMLNMPPRFGKSRTAVLFSQWLFGKDPETSVISITYNEKLSGMFSKGVRDGIAEPKLGEELPVFSDVFPNTRIKHGDGAAHQWALEGSHFSYLGTSFNATITGIGCKVNIIDDSIRTHEDALNKDLLDKQWEWLLATMEQRLEQDMYGDEAIQIIFMTRWTKLDICGRLLELEPEEWYQLKYEAFYEELNKMLHEGTMSRRRYMKLKRKIDNSNSMVARLIFYANFHQRTMDSENQVFQNLREWYVRIERGDYVLYVAGVPIKRKNVHDCPNGYDDLFETILSYTDVADEGKDWLCSIPFGVLEGQGYILAPYYTDKQMETTEIELAENLYTNNVKHAKIERNNGARTFGRNVKRLVWQNHGSRAIEFSYLWQKKNKDARILSNSSFVINNIFFPEGWQQKFPEFYRDLTGYMKGAKNQVDDAPDAITGVAEMLQGQFPQETGEDDYEETSDDAANRANSRRVASRV